MDKIARLIVAGLLLLMLGFLAAVRKESGLFSDDMATWLQAFGAIIALAIAVGAPMLQARRARADTLVVLAEVTSHAASLVRVAAERESRSRWMDGRPAGDEVPALQDAVKALQSIPLLQIPSGGAARDVIVLTRLVRAALVVIDEGAPDGVSEMDALRPLADEADGCATSIARLAKFHGVP